MGKRYLPSSALPDFFKSDLRIGEKQAHPLPALLDEFADRVAFFSYLSAYDLVASTASLPIQRLELERLGFETASLAEAQRAELYRVRLAIVEVRGTLPSIQRLARVYFGAVRVRVGRGLGPRGTGTVSQFRLGDEQASRTIWVRLADPATGETKQEFLRNANRLVPVPYRVEVVDPKKVQAPEERADLGQPRSWQNRRLACPTFPR